MYEEGSTPELTFMVSTACGGVGETPTIGFGLATTNIFINFSKAAVVSVRLV